MKRLLFKREEGVAGLNVLLSVVIFLFMIGFIVMIFALLGGELESEDTISESQGPYTVVNETVTFPSFPLGTYPSGTPTALTTCGGTMAQATITVITNATDPSAIVPASNYTWTGCNLFTVQNSSYNQTSVNVSYTYVSGGSALRSINATYTEISEVTDWFGIIIVISAMVVLILLTVVIISAMRGTGLVAIGGESKEPKYTA